MQVCIMTPDRIFWNQQAEEIILPTNTGQMGVLKNHAPLMTALDIGVMLIRTKMEWTSVALLGGFALIKQNKVTVLGQSGRNPNTIDPEQAEKTYQEAQRQWVDATGAKQKVEANFALKRARARLQLVKNR